MNAFFQFVTYEQGVSQFELFEVAAHLLGSHTISERFSWVGIDGRLKSVASLGELRSKSVGEKFVEIGYEMSFEPFQVSQGVRVNEAFGVFRLPGTSPLWANPEYLSRSKRLSMHRRTRHAVNVVDVIERSGIKSFPAVLEFTLKLTGSRSVDRVAEAVARWLGERGKKSRYPFVACGTVDFGDDMLFSKMDMLNLKSMEHSILQFEHRFVNGDRPLRTHIDRLHKIHILPSSTCIGLAKRLDLPSPTRFGVSLSILVIPSSVLRDPTGIVRAGEIAIRRDDSTSWIGIVKREIEK